MINFLSSSKRLTNFVPSQLFNLYMKRILNYLAYSVLLFSMACTDENPANPNEDARDKFTGSWKCKETIAGTPQTFNISISKSGESDTLLISNFSNYGSSAVAEGYVAGNSLTIPSQDIGVTNIPVSGTGVYSDAGGTEKITMNYLTDGQSATAICTR
jgi:hypothetical protein